MATAGCGSAVDVAQRAGAGARDREVAMLWGRHDSMWGPLRGCVWESAIAGKDRDNQENTLL